MPNRPKASDASGNLWCPRCKKFRAISEYHKLSTGRASVKKSFHGVQSWCIECAEERRIAYHSVPRAHLLALVNGASKRSGRNCDLDREWAVRRFEVQGGFCHYTGIQMTFGQGKGRIWSNASLDRIDSSLEYTGSNCVLCCAGFNLMKTNLPLDAMVDMCRRFIALHG